MPPLESHNSVPPLTLSLRMRLSGMFFLQYAIWVLGSLCCGHFWLDTANLNPAKLATCLRWAAGAVLAPFIAGQIADRYFATEKFLGISHLIVSSRLAVGQLGKLFCFPAVLLVLFRGLFSYALANQLAGVPSSARPQSRFWSSSRVGHRGLDLRRHRAWRNGWPSITHLPV